MGRGDWGELWRGNGCMVIAGAFIPATPSCGVDGSLIRSTSAGKGLSRRRRGGEGAERRNSREWNIF